jgi:hypothetical protein
MVSLRNPENVIPLVLAIAATIWSLSFWIKPAKYNPDSILHRQIYLWYVSWFGKKLDENYELESEEVRRAGIVMTCIGVFALALFVLSMVPT